jgi:hypothetical protein
MAIYPYTNTYVINKDAVAGSQFKAGMVLMMNADGKAVPADSQLLVFNSLGQKQAKILGLAAGDSNLTGNTIIVPDTVGNNYLDENKNFVNASNAEYVAIKRQLLDYADETINEYYNMNFSPIPKRRGIGVYSLTGDTFATDQFKAVLHGDYGIDGTETISFSTGDLLTFGGGVNAGKLVKVNTNSFGPDVVVVGIVEKYNSNIGLLYFRYILDNVSFGTNPYVLAIDAGNTSSYVNGSSTTTNLVNGTSGGNLVNGTSYTSANTGAWIFDGVNDYINTSFSGSFASNATIVMWIQLDVENPPNNSLGGLLGFDDGGAVGPSYYTFWADAKAYINVFRNGRIGPITLGSTVKIQPHMVTITTDGTDWKFYQNTSLITTAVAQATVRLLTPYIGKGYYDVMFQGKVFQFNLLNQALTQAQITNYYNATKSRYGL